MIKKIFNSLFGLYKENAMLVIKIFGIKAKLHWANINQLEDVCCIRNLKELKEQNTYFPHPIGIVIHSEALIGKNCVIFQNVTIGDGKFNNERGRSVPIIGDNVTIYANSVIIGGITVGDNSVIGANSVVIKDVPDNSVIAGNPARIIRKSDIPAQQ